MSRAETKCSHCKKPLDADNCEVFQFGDKSYNFHQKCGGVGSQAVIKMAAPSPSMAKALVTAKGFNGKSKFLAKREHKEEKPKEEKSFYWGRSHCSVGSEIQNVIANMELAGPFYKREDAVAGAYEKAADHMFDCLPDEMKNNAEAKRLFKLMKGKVRNDAAMATLSRLCINIHAFITVLELKGGKLTETPNGDIPRRNITNIVILV